MSQDWLLGSGFMFPPETTKKLNKICEASVFKILYTCQWRTVMPERQEINEVSPTIAPVYCFETLEECPAISTGKGNPDITQRTKEKARQSWVPREAKVATVHRKGVRGEKAAKREDFRSAANFHKDSADSPSARVWENYLRPEEEPS